ncbi:hydantoinase/oxoprolinase family protein [Oryzicola mucosus]|uniref:Hydantoinase/oxoprolinase family protein n=1 Tax=Oryzicola mucosus TaxID=2767425 RepID=A0A8J6PWL8_9HYPH|nr:hydantoinase/oxoprolinase family protein [Oryzicola mucosus]MBD0415568.1 hydantoinase/oxoprolinase family protein [Oryzicola mucosus]
MSMASKTTAWRIGIDVGGTFNDFVAAENGTGRRVFFKEPSVPSDPSLAVERGIAGLLNKAGIAPDAVELVMHGTTLALNSILQRNGPRLGMVVSRGNRDVFEIARSRMPSAFDFTAKRETPLIPRNLVFEVGARCLSSGDIVDRPDEAALDRLAEQVRAADLKAVAVMLINSFRHPELEREVADGLRKRLPNLPITESAAIWPEMREYERGLLAALNAYIQPLMQSYFDRLETRLRGLGLTAPIFITTNNGGTVSLATARARPIDTVLSGPAAGVVAAVKMAPEDVRDHLVTLDMGGTSTDMAVVIGGEPEYTQLAQVGAFPIILPVVAVTAIGAGGGSTVWIDPQGILKIGPESVGSDPGPICYGRGGTRVAITDCYLASGILDPNAFLGGRMPLAKEPALAGLAKLARDIGLTGENAAEEAASAALRVATAKMSVELSKMLAKRGLDHRQFALVAFGGAGATHATLLAEEARLEKVIIPLAPGTFCALGASLADIRRDYARSLGGFLQPDGQGFAPVAAALAEMKADALSWIAGETDSDADLSFRVKADMRFADQAYELEIFVPEALRETLDGVALLELFHAEHERLYGFADRVASVRISTIRLSIAALNATTGSTAIEPRKAPQAGTRRVFHKSRRLDAPLYRRFDLPAGFEITGPAVVEQDDTTVWIVPGWQCRVEPMGNLVLTPQKQARAIENERTIVKAIA